MRPARLSGVAALAAACAGTALWCSLGVLAVTDAGPAAQRVGLLPSWWVLAGCLGLMVGLAWTLRPSRDRVLPLLFTAILIVPWLPIPMPTPLLAWTGPVVWLVWAAIIGAMLVAGPASERRIAWWRSWFESPGRAPIVAGMCAALVYVAAASQLAARVPSGDEPHYLVITQSLLGDGDLRIENNHRQRDYAAFYAGTLKSDYLRRGQNGQIYSIHMPGLSALILPVFAIGGYGLVKWVLALVSAAATAVAWRAAFALTGDGASAWFAWAATGLTAPFLFLSFTVYPDVPGSIVVLLAGAALVSLGARPSRPAWWWAGVGVLPALLPWLHPRYAVIAGALGVIFALRTLRDLRPRAALAAFLAMPVASAAGWFGYYYAIYGALNPSVAYGYVTQMSVGRIPTGVLGLLVDQQYGLLTSAPVYVAAILGIVPLVGRHRRLALEWLWIVVPYMLVASAYHMWWGGFSSPARFLGPVLLVSALPLSTAWATARDRATRGWLALSLAISMALALGFSLAEGGQFVFNGRAAIAPWLTWTSQIVDLARAVPGLFRGSSALAAGETVVWLTAISMAWAIARALERRWQAGPGLVGLVLLAGVGLASSAAMAAVWQIEQVSGISPLTGQLRAVRAAASPVSTVGIAFDPPALISASALVARMRLGSDRAGGGPAWAWLWLPNVPAGHYRLRFDGPTSASTGSVALLVGRADTAVQVWPLNHQAANEGGYDIWLPVNVRSLAVRGDGAVPRQPRVWLQPVSITPVGLRSSGERANSARRYGDVVIYGLGEAVYLEPEGLWTAGGEMATLVLMAPVDRKSQTFRLQAGGAATPVRIEWSGYQTTFALAAGEVREVIVALNPGQPTVVRILAEQGFRPAAIDSASSDQRWLGVRLEPIAK